MCLRDDSLCLPWLLQIRTVPQARRWRLLIDREVQRILHEGYEMAREVLNTHSDQLTRLADALMSQEQLDRKQFEALLA